MIGARALPLHGASRRGESRGVWSVVCARRTWISLALVACAATLAAGVVAAMDYISQVDRFPVRSLRMEGDFVRLSRTDLVGAIAPHARGNFFLLDIDAVTAAVAQQPWIRHVSVRRQWPDTVAVYFQEHRLHARWGQDRWLNSHGEVVDLRGAAAPSGLPLLVGPAGSERQVLAQYRSLNEQVKQIGLDVARLELSPRRMWQMSLSNNLSLLLGRGEPQPKLARFLAVYGDTVASRIEQITHVDLRYTNGFSVQWVRAHGAGAGGIGG